MTKRKIVFFSAVCFSLAVFSVQTLSQNANANRTAGTQSIKRSQFNNKYAESLNIRWRSIEYIKTLYNSALTSNKRIMPKAESLLLSFEVEMPDSGLILTTCPNAVIEKVTDSRGGNIDIGPSSSESRVMYRPNPRFMEVGPPSGPERHTLRVGLDAGLLKQINGEIGLKGYFYALVAESLEYVELPFEVNDNWVRLTPDVEIRVREARNEASQHRFDIEQRAEIVTDLFDVQIGDYLPGRLILNREFIAQISAVGSGGAGSTGGRIGGRGFGIGRAEKIRFNIAINPAHQIIPFEIKRIPLSDLAEPSTAQTNTSNQKGLKRLSEQVKPQFNKEVAACFEINWSSITYRKTLFNPAISGKSRDRRVSEKLAVHCEARILDPEMIIGTCDIPVIEQITDGKGRDTDISRTEPRSNRMFYSALGYQQSLIPTPPSMPIYWEGRVRSALGLPLLARHRPKRKYELQPVHLGIQLDPGLIRQDPKEIGSIKGYFHVLTAESSKHVEVPFKPDNKWVRLTPETWAGRNQYARLVSR